jgi:hypothetical protein
MGVGSNILEQNFLGQQQMMQPRSSMGFNQGNGMNNSAMGMMFN